MELTDMEADLLCHFIEGFEHPWILASSEVLEPIPHGYQTTTVLTMPLMITGKKLCSVTYNEFRFAE